MKKLLRRLLNVLAYLAATVVIVLAIGVGLFRLFLPKLPEYQEDLKAWANQAIGMNVEFAGMNARWRLSGPELNFYDAKLSLPDDKSVLVSAAEVTVGVGLLRLISDRTLVVDRILVRETELAFIRRDDGGLDVQGVALDQLTELIPESNDSADVVVIGEDIRISYRSPEIEDPLVLDVELVEATRDSDALSVEAKLDLNDEYGNRLDVSADQQPSDDGTLVWEMFLEGRALRLPRWSFLLPGGMADIVSGSGDVSLWAVVSSEGTLRKASANLALNNFSIAGADRGAAFGIDGRLEYANSAAGVVIAAENFRLDTVDSTWPGSRLQVRLDRTLDDEATPTLNGIDVTATYARIDDLAYFVPWLPNDVRDRFREFRPTGEVSDVELHVSELGNDGQRFDFSAVLSDAGLQATEQWPGFRGFSGTVRADTQGGRVEFASNALRFNIPKYLSETIVFDDAIGTVIWRKSGERLTILSDRLDLRTADFDSKSSLQVTVDGANAAPVVDFESAWSVNDVVSVRRFLPEPIIHPALFRWLNNALQSGSMTDGATRLSGSLDKFPFDDGSGEFVISTTLNDAVMEYATGWPSAEIQSMDIVLDGLRLYSQQNFALTAGNQTTNAHVEIADLREPVLTIEAFSTGTLDTIREYVQQSPIDSVFGGNLDLVTVEGDASFSLDLKYPLKDKQNYEFLTKIQASDGTVRLRDFEPPLTGVNGMVTISREELSSESLFGRFLGEPVSIDLSRPTEASSQFSAIATAHGRVTGNGLVAELGVPLGDRLAGAGDYAAEIRFPTAGQDDPVPVQIAIQSDLAGFDLDLPEPFGKEPSSTRPLAMSIEFPGDARLMSNGSLGDLRWSMQFENASGRWNFDRGAMSLGGAYPEYPESRGLHVQGHAERIRLDDWLSLSRDSPAESGGAGSNLIRSIDLTIDHLYLFGQHLEDHRITVDRSGSDWFVSAAGEQIAGTITIPYDLSGDRPVTMAMDSLILPGDGDEESDEDEEETLVDPRRMPPISVRAAEFAIGERYFGSLEADFRRTNDGLRATGIKAVDTTFEIEGTGGWVADARLPGGQQSYLSAKLRSRNVEKTMERLNYSPGIDGEDLEIDVDVRWPGAPRDDFAADLNGEVVVRFGSGQLNEVEPGAGRVFGLMSVVALPRRLSLDFRDVLDKGFGFDEISGTFLIKNGVASTCDLSLKGPAADIGIVGQAGLASEEYNQTAMVSTNVGNTLPVVGAVVAGPQVAAALLIFSQIFKKPLKEMSQVYYGIDGTFDEPLVDSAGADRFAQTSELAGCLADVN